MNNIKYNNYEDDDILYPITYKDQLYYEDDVDDLFACYYTSKESLNDDCSVYVADGIYVFPDGETYD